MVFRGSYLLAALAVGVVNVVEAVLVDLAQPDVLPDAHQAIGVSPAVPPAEPAPPQLSPSPKGRSCPFLGGRVWGMRTRGTP